MEKKVNGRDEPLLKHSHTCEGVLPSGVRVKVDVYKFRNDERRNPYPFVNKIRPIDRIYLD